MITIDGKDYYTWDEVVEIILHMQEHGITVEKNDDYIPTPPIITTSEGNEYICNNGKWECIKYNI